QIIREGQRLDDRVGDDDLEACYFIEERIGLGVGPVRAEVVAHPVAQRSCLPDVNRLARRVEIQIHPRLLGQPRDLLLEFADGHTLLWRVFAACLNLRLYPRIRLPTWYQRRARTAHLRAHAARRHRAPE